jgi:chorismate-pyruvate lyase
MNQRKIESRREIRRIEIVCNEEVSELFGVAQSVPLLSRTYDIISHDTVLIRITETFPSTSFALTAMEMP